MVEQVVDPNDLATAHEVVADVHVADPVFEYILDIVQATRDAADIDHGASPRASLALLNTAKARAAIRGREYVIPADVKALALPVLRHRIVLSTEAELGGEGVDELIERLVEGVTLPEESVDDVVDQPTESPTE